jgi:hypothetical protein
MINRLKTTEDIMLFQSLFKMLTLSSIAYLDPGSGSVILQVLIASLVGIGFALRGYWGKIKKLFNKDAREEEVDDLDELDNE